MVCRRRRAPSVGLKIISLVFCLVFAGCGSITPLENFTYGSIAATLLGGQSPNNEIQQIYYLGVFDPQEQVPPTVLRVRVHGQASFISLTRFASGWVPAQLIDSLSSGVKFQSKTGDLSITKAGEGEVAALKPGRRMVLFGPEGFREAPKDHRLVIVMGSSPEDFFNAIDQSLGAVSEVLEERRATELTRELFEALVQIKSEKDTLASLEKNVAIEKGGK